MTCPHCGRVNDQHAHTEGRATPDVGDVALCWLCHGLSVYDRGPLGELVQRLPSEAESAEIEADPRITQARRALEAAATPSMAIDVLRGSS